MPTGRFSSARTILMTDQKPTSANRILDTALELFSVRGYEATSVREICEAACITKPTLYYFYGSKEGVFRALVNRTLEEVREDIVAALARPEPLIERLRLIAATFFAKASARRTLWRLIASAMWMPNASHASDLPCAYEDYNKMLGEAIDSAVARGELTPGPTDIRMMVLFGALGEALDRFLLFDAPQLTPQLADQLIDVAVRGWLTPASLDSSSPSAVSSSLSSSSSSSSSSASSPVSVPSSSRTL